MIGSGVLSRRRLVLYNGSLARKNWGKKETRGREQAASPKMQQPQCDRFWVCKIQVMYRRCCKAKQAKINRLATRRAGNQLRAPAGSESSLDQSTPRAGRRRPPLGLRPAHRPPALEGHALDALNVRHKPKLLAERDDLVKGLRFAEGSGWGLGAFQGIGGVF